MTVGPNQKAKQRQSQRVLDMLPMTEDGSRWKVEPPHRGHPLPKLEVLPLRFASVRMTGLKRCAYLAPRNVIAAPEMTPLICEVIGMTGCFSTVSVPVSTHQQNVRRSFAKT